MNMRARIAFVAFGLFMIVTAIAGFAPTSDAGVLSERGLASWYGPGFEGRKTASGESFDPLAMTAAHRDFPLGTVIMVTNLKNGRQVQVKINDRGPHVRGRIIDVSAGAARKLKMIEAGTAPVRIDVIGGGDAAGSTGPKP